VKYLKFLEFLLYEGVTSKFFFFLNKINTFFARLYSICLFTTSVVKTVSCVYSLLTRNSTVSNFWCSRTVSKFIQN
jgi:hypothetical protein